MPFRLTWEKQHNSEPLQEPEFNVDCFENVAVQLATMFLPTDRMSSLPSAFHIRRAGSVGEGGDVRGLGKEMVEKEGFPRKSSKATLKQGNDQGCISEERNSPVNRSGAKQAFI